ncbi:hypothetical protein [Spirosoma validum]|uniref:Uncharacterized protein n=1 Tax=Spirosoma validum TaxID=2771355 RepID=A0A927GCU8_9BACT|nr:hypothetical protein [Spirosoma validum]MBD2753039.1 hypothetical protein [Spirosoma validum]
MTSEESRNNQFAKKPRLSDFSVAFWYLKMCWQNLPFSIRNAWAVTTPAGCVVIKLADVRHVIQQHPDGNTIGPLL